MGVTPNKREKKRRSKKPKRGSRGERRSQTEWSTQWESEWEGCECEAEAEDALVYERQAQIADELIQIFCPDDEAAPNRSTRTTITITTTVTTVTDTATVTTVTTTTYIITDRPALHGFVAPKFADEEDDHHPL
ncbi:uncharacterized protein PV06_08337 [Exophiala oligosperma]|uniref:Uncharacterized protein n=2 Tax=Chaetothyriales TaxID=34395 RepID=A0A0D2AHX5_9EURO|nr:uncharacterized protein PV06_08337 [Exophiala oligosperma]KAJ9622161.1 hypothetical protein H2204_011668 [Knufia peltigerae]KIW39751.1 hypothetical protein PV06_08337 [Exophiala oligosperma]